MIYKINKKEYLDMFNVERDLWWYKGLRETLSYFLKKYVRKNSYVLDAGCGTGMNMKLLSDMKYKAYGFDISREAVELCKARGIRNIRVASITEIPYKKESFQAIINMDVLGLLNSKSAKIALNEFWRVLGPGGFLLMQCAAFEWLRSQHDEVNKLKYRYTKSDLLNMFDPNKWEIEKASYRIFLLFIPVAILKLIKKLTSRINSSAANDLQIPYPLLNTILYYIQKLESLLGRYINFPLGTSVFIIVRKK